MPSDVPRILRISNQLIEKVREATPRDAISALAVAVGRLCYLTSVPLEVAFDLARESFDACTDDETTEGERESPQA